MFWADVVKSNYKCCTCDGSWKYSKIVNTDVMGELLNFSLTPLHGNTCLIFSLRKGEHLPPIRDFCFNLKPFQHVKLEAYGGNVTLARESHEGTETYKNNDRFAMNCPFGDEECLGLMNKSLEMWEINQVKRFRKQIVMMNKNRIKLYDP